MSEVITFDPRWQGMQSNPYLGSEWRRYLVGPELQRIAPDAVPPATGVYFLFDGDSLVYIGQSQSMKSRVESHRRNGRPFTTVGFVEVPGDLCVAVETAYINALRPRGNLSVEPPMFFQHWRLFDAILDAWKIVPLQSVMPLAALPQNAERSGGK